MNNMETMKFDGGFAQCDKRELSKLIAEDETTILGLCYEEYADVFFLNREFQKIAKAIEECYVNTDSGNCSTYKLNDNLAITLKVLPATNGGEKALAMSLISNNKEVYKLVKTISGLEAGNQERAHESTIDLITKWIICASEMTRDEIKPILFWLLDQDEETVHDMLEQV